ANPLIDQTQTQIGRLRESANIKSPEFATESTNLGNQLKSLREEPLTAQKVQAVDQQFGKVIKEAERAGATEQQLQGLRAAQKLVNDKLADTLGASEPTPAVRPAPNVRPAATEPVEQGAPSPRPVEAARPLETARPVEPATANPLIDQTETQIGR